MVLGLDDDEMLVFLEYNHPSRLIFEELKPAFENRKVMSLIAISHPGKGIILDRKC